MRAIFHSAAFVLLAAIFFLSCNNDAGPSELTLFPVATDEDYMFIDNKGKIVINPQFGEASVHRNGIALVKTSGEKGVWGYIDEKGTYVINAQYKEATVFQEDIAWVVSEGSTPTAINEKGDVLFLAQDARYVRVFSEGLAAYRNNGTEEKARWGFLDKSGNVAIQPQFGFASDFHEGLCCVRNEEDKFGFADKQGTIVINYQFESAGDFSNGHAVVVSNDKYGVIDAAGKYVVNPQYDEITLDGDRILFRQKDKWGWAELNGTITINPQFVSAVPFGNNDLAAVESGNKWGFINRDGTFEINPQFDRAFSFNGDLALVTTGSSYGFVNREGKYVINPQYQKVSYDMIYHIVLGQTEYRAVESDYFDAGAILGVVNLLSPEGFGRETTFGEVAQKYGKEGSDFEDYSSLHEMVEETEISADAFYSFYVAGLAHKLETVQKGSGWFTYNDYNWVFDPAVKPSYYVYRIYLRGQAMGREEKVIDLLKETLNGFEEIENEEGKTEFSNGEQTVQFSYESGRIDILIEFNGVETVVEAP
ncbi:MAG: hypothetical protein RL220_1780 [Bacteroidota bacterium]